MLKRKVLIVVSTVVIVICTTTGYFLFNTKNKHIEVRSTKIAPTQKSAETPTPTATPSATLRPSISSSQKRSPTQSKAIVPTSTQAVIATQQPINNPTSTPAPVVNTTIPTPFPTPTGDPNMPRFEWSTNDCTLIKPVNFPSPGRLHYNSTGQTTLNVMKGSNTIFSQDVSGSGDITISEAGDYTVTLGTSCSYITVSAYY